MPLQATSGAASYDAFGGGVAAVPNYIEECFSTFLYTGNGSTQTINNGIDLAGKGGLVWIKQRNTTRNPTVFDTINGTGKYLSTDAASALNTGFPDTLTAFNSNGFSLGADSGTLRVNQSGGTYASWTFREQPKFFDVVTWTGDGVVGRQISHALGSTPGCIIVKRTSSSADWVVHHRSLGFSQVLFLNTTEGVTGSGAIRGSTTTTFEVSDSATVNSNGATYVAYLFAHNAGGFGLTGTDNVISCGSYTGNGGLNGPTVTLGYEPQWLLIKNSSASGFDWAMLDSMRGLNLSTVSGAADNILSANTSSAEFNNQFVDPNATGFRLMTDGSNLNASGNNYIYIAIRRGPMRTPTTGTSVFQPAISTNNLPAWSTGFPVDMGILGSIAGSDKMYNAARLMGDTSQLKTNTTDAAANWLGNQRFDQMNGYGVASTWGTGYIGWMMRRAPSFMDVVCYTGTGTAGQTYAHNLGAVPELMIVKRRNTAGGWATYCAPLGNTAFLYVNSTGAADSGFNQWNNTSPTTTQFSVSTSSDVNASSGTYVNYLFASCPGVSKVGSYTGNGSSQTINCGFAGGARFVMVKRTDSTGNWMVVDTARGLVSAGDPTLYLNSTAAEVTGVDWLDPDSSGFIVNQEGTMNANVNAATYIYLAIA